MGFQKSTHKAIKVPSKAQLYRQTYESVHNIEGVYVGRVNTFADDYGGWFKESMRIDNYGHNITLKNEGIVFKPIQFNTSFLAPKTKRFWHIHPVQNEVWTTNGTILLGLIDYRTNSKTYNKKMKVVLSADKFIYIPCGIAHGFINPSSTAITLNYATDQYFVADNNTQEYRIDPKKVSYKFVKSELM